MGNFKLNYCFGLICVAGTFLVFSCTKNQRETQNPIINTKVGEREAEVNLTTDSDIFTGITWSTAKSQPAVTHEVHGEVVKGKLYIFGGYDINKRPGWTPTKRSYVYTPISNTWASIANLPHIPNGSSFGGITHVGLTNDGTDIYFAGGYTSNANGTGQVFGTRQVWKYIVESNTYARLPDLPQELAAGQLRYVNGRLHYMGGANLARADVGVHYALDLKNLASGWKTLAPVLNPVNHPGSAVLNGKIYFLGGAHHQDDATETQTTLEVYNETTNLWTQLANMPIGVDHISSAVVTFGNRIIVLGGETSHNVLSKQVMAYNPNGNTWAELTPLSVGKSAGVGAVINGILYYTGGNFSNTNHKGVPNDNAAVSSFTLLPIDDAFVRNGGFAANNYGNDTSLFIKGSTVSGYSRKSYLKFDIANTKTNIASAKLRLYGRNIDNTNTFKLTCFGVESETWTEAGINFNNAPITGNALSSASLNNQAKYIEFDITDFVKKHLLDDKIVNLAIKDPDNSNSTFQFNSKENATNTPQLIIK